MLYLFGFLVIFVMGGLTGVMLALVPFNWQVHDTHFVVAHLHYVLFGGFLFPFFAACYYWYPQMIRSMPRGPSLLCISGLKTPSGGAEGSGLIFHSTLQHLILLLIIVRSDPDCIFGCRMPPPV